MPSNPKALATDVLVWNGKRVAVTQPCLIGRGADNDLVLNDGEVSRRHAVLFRHDEECWVTDAGSRNGVLVNGVRLNHARRLRDGDELRVGSHRLVFASGADTPRSSVITLGVTTMISPEGKGAAFPGAMVCELIVASATGEILEGDRAARWFFGKNLERIPGAAHSILPQPVRAWLERQTADGKSGSAPLELQEMDRRVMITLCRCNAGRYFLLVREESAKIAADRLQSLGLSQREAEVMHWVCEGKTNPEIATILTITVHTVNRHIEHIFSKLDVDNRQKAIVAVMERLGV